MHKVQNLKIDYRPETTFVTMHLSRIHGPSAEELVLKHHRKYIQSTTHNF